ncbi:MAG: coproporphyrinogen-III oxidase family protein, partial [Pseudomonadota bacterium]
GVNRVSLGVQALNDADLRALGRLHSADEARAAVALANSVFERVSFDLIYARTGQSLAAWDAELGEALAMAAGHLSLYQLTIEPGTPFEKLHAAGRLVIPDEALADDMYALTGDRCAAAGLPLYEISNYARPGEESQHNLVYWRYGAYVGIGPGAHGRPVIDGSRYATRTEPHPETWLAQVGERGTGRVEMQKVSAAEAADEALLMGLRLAEGIDLTAFERRLGVALDAGTMAELTEAGLLMAPGPGRIAASPRGRFLLNRLVLELSETMKLVA